MHEDRPLQKIQDDAMARPILLLLISNGSWSPEKTEIKSARKSQKFQDDEIICMNKTK